VLDVLSDVTRNLVVLIIAATLLDLLLPRNDFRPFVNMVIGLVLMLTLLAPLRMLLRMPGDLEPAVFRAVGVSDTDIAAREEMLSQFNWELAISRYRELLQARVSAVLLEEKMSLEELYLEIIDDPGHPEFGRAQQVVALVRSGATAGGSIRPVEPVRIGGTSVLAGESEGEPDYRLSLKLALALGLSEEKVSVRVLN